MKPQTRQGLVSVRITYQYWTTFAERCELIQGSPLFDYTLRADGSWHLLEDTFAIVANCRLIRRHVLTLDITVPEFVNSSSAKRLLNSHLHESNGKHLDSTSELLSDSRACCRACLCERALVRLCAPAHACLHHGTNDAALIIEAIFTEIEKSRV